MKSIAVNGTEIHYADRGSGTPLLLVHGFPLDHSMWDDLHFNGSNVRTIAPDLPGFGLSGTICGAGVSPASSRRDACATIRDAVDRQVSSARGETATMEQYADVLAGLLDALAIDKAVLCGLSMGGYIALQFQRKYPERLLGLIFCDTRAAADTPEAARARGVMVERVMREGAEPIIETMLPKLLAEKTKRENPQLVERLQRMMAGTDRRGIAAALRGMAARPDMTAALPDISCPTLILVGGDDVITPPAEMRSMAEAIPNARYVEIAGAGHLAPLEAPSAVSSAIGDFLRSI